MNTLKLIEKYILKVEFVVVAVVLLGMCFLAFVQVALRNAISFSFIWGDALVRLLVLWLGIFGASIATSDRGHIHIDLMTKVVPKRFGRYLDAVVDAVATGCCVGFLIIAIRFIKVEREVGNMEHLLHTPEWYFMLAFPIGLGLIAFKFLIRFLDDLFDARQEETK